MRVNKRFIELGIYGKTLNKAQFEILGQTYPPNENWEVLVLDKELSTKDSNLFLLLRGKLALKAQEQIIKNYQLLAQFHSDKKSNQSEKEEKPQTKSSNNDSKKIEIYCDGACKNNPGKAGSGLAIYVDDKQPVLLYGAYEERGTNNTAELEALHKAMLLALEYAPTKVTIYSDSMYSIDCITKWAYSWKNNGWSRKGKEIKNLEIIKIAHRLYEEIKNHVNIKHVKAHVGVEGNELADRMAVWAIVSKCEEYKCYDYTTINDVLSMSEG